MKVAGAVLCGGRSSRMGTDKALVPVDGVPMAQTVVAALSSAGCVPVLAIGGDAAALGALGLMVIPDEFPGDGPLAGLCAALHALEGADAVAVVACDMPYVQPHTIQRLCEALRDAPEALVAVANTDRLQPLCAVWRRAAWPILNLLLGAGERRMLVAVDAVPSVCVSVNAQDVANINTPADLPTRL